MSLGTDEVFDKDLRYCHGSLWCFQILRGLVGFLVELRRDGVFADELSDF